ERGGEEGRAPVAQHRELRRGGWLSRGLVRGWGIDTNGGCHMTSQRQTDAQGRVALPEDFANATVTVERVSDDEVRSRKVKAGRRRYTFKQLMAGVTRKNIHAAIDTGPPVGREAL